MTIDTLLTSIIAREHLGELVVVEESRKGLIKHLTESDSLIDPTKGYKLESDPNNYDITWTFYSESRIVKALDIFNQLENELGVGSNDQRILDQYRTSSILSRKEISL